MSIATPWKELHRLIASAPASMQLKATAFSSGDCGVSFTQSGFVVTARTAATTVFAEEQLIPNAAPPALTLGHEILSSITGTSVFSRSFAPST